MEINLNFVLFEGLRDRPDGGGAEARIVIIRESKDMDSAMELWRARVRLARIISATV